MKIDGFVNNVFILKEIGSRIKDTRIAMRLSQEDFASKAGISVRTLSRVELGENSKFDVYLNIFRTMDLLGNIDLLIPEQTVKPTDIADRIKKKSRIGKKSSSRENLEDDNFWEAE